LPGFGLVPSAGSVASRSVAAPITAPARRYRRLRTATGSNVWQRVWTCAQHRGGGARRIGGGTRRSGWRRGRRRPAGAGERFIAARALIA
jgi:hypothetical protein